MRCDVFANGVDRSAEHLVSGPSQSFNQPSILFVQLEKLHSFLDTWTQSGSHLQPEVANYLKGHFLASRYAIGTYRVQVPISDFRYRIVRTTIGTFGSMLQSDISLRRGNGANGINKTSAIGGKAIVRKSIIFLGKDIAYFHTLFWPGILKSSAIRSRSSVIFMAFLTVDGEKMSKTKGTQIQASTYLKHLDPSYLRYFMRPSSVRNWMIST